MARTRVYRHGLRRPHCGSNWTPKDGRSREKRACRRRDCRHRFTPEGNRHYFPEDLKRRAPDLYAGGAGIAATGRAPGVRTAAVFSWVKKARRSGELMGRPVRERALRRPGVPRARVISFDETWTYAGARRRGKRREAWIWTAAAADGPVSENNGGGF